MKNVLPFETEKDSVLAVRLWWDGGIFVVVLGVRKRWGILHGKVVDIMYMFCSRLNGGFVDDGYIVIDAERNIYLDRSLMQD